MIATKITNIKAAHKGYEASLVTKIAYMVRRETGMSLNMAVAFAASQVKGFKGLDVVR